MASTPGRYKSLSKEVVRTERYEIDAGKYGWSAGTTSSVRSALYTCENTFRSGLENAVEVYCMRSSRPGSPQAQVADSFFARLTAAIPATSTRTNSAIQGSTAESDAAAWGNAAPGMSSSVKAPKLPSTRPGKIPIATHAVASANMPACMGQETSCALSASRLRGRPRKATPYTLAKHAAANPPINASTPAANGNMMAAERSVISEPAKKLRKVSHSLTKPLNNGKPTMEQQATRNTAPVRGRRFCNPPSSSKSRV